MDIMYAIADIEQKLQEIMTSANELEKSQNGVLKEEFLQKENCIKEKLREEKEKLDRQADAEIQLELEALEKRYAKKLEELEAKCLKDKQSWVLDITNMVIKG